MQYQRQQLSQSSSFRQSDFGGYQVVHSQPTYSSYVGSTSTSQSMAQSGRGQLANSLGNSSHQSSYSQYSQHNLNKPAY